MKHDFKTTSDGRLIIGDGDSDDDDDKTVKRASSKKRKMVINDDDDDLNDLLDTLRGDHLKV